MEIVNINGNQYQIPEEFVEELLWFEEGEPIPLIESQENFELSSSEESQILQEWEEIVLEERVEENFSTHWSYLLKDKEPSAGGTEYSTIRYLVPKENRFGFDEVNPTFEDFHVFRKAKFTEDKRKASLDEAKQEWLRKAEPFRVEASILPQGFQPAPNLKREVEQELSFELPGEFGDDGEEKVYVSPSGEVFKGSCLEDFLDKLS